jgi:hypothetical protein
MKIVHLLSPMLLASIVLFAGCSSGHRGESRVSRRSVQNESGSLRIPYDLSRSASRFSLSLTLRASEGSFVYTLTDPQGTPVWQGWINAGQSLNESRPLRPLAGKWILTLVLQGTTGSYNALWESR